MIFSFKWSWSVQKE